MFLRESWESGKSRTINIQLSLIESKSCSHSFEVAFRLMRSDEFRHFIVSTVYIHGILCEAYIGFNMSLTFNMKGFLLELGEVQIAELQKKCNLSLWYRPKFPTGRC